MQAAKQNWRGEGSASGRQASPRRNSGFFSFFKRNRVEADAAPWEKGLTLKALSRMDPKDAAEAFRGGEKAHSLGIYGVFNFNKNSKKKCDAAAKIVREMIAGGGQALAQRLLKHERAGESILENERLLGGLEHYAAPLALKIAATASEVFPSWYLTDPIKSPFKGRELGLARAIKDTSIEQMAAEFPKIAYIAVRLLCDYKPARNEAVARDAGIRLALCILKFPEISSHRPKDRPGDWKMRYLDEPRLEEVAFSMLMRGFFPENKQASAEEMLAALKKAIACLKENGLGKSLMEKVCLEHGMENAPKLGAEGTRAVLEGLKAIALENELGESTLNKITNAMALRVIYEMKKAKDDLVVVGQRDLGHREETRTETIDTDTYGYGITPYTRTERYEIREGEKFLETRSNWEKREKLHATLKEYGAHAIPALLNEVKNEDFKNESSVYCTEIQNYHATRCFAAARCARLLEELKPRITDPEQLEQAERALARAKEQGHPMDLAPEVKKWTWRYSEKKLIG